MASALTTIPKIAACLGMLGSDHDGEVLAAARAAERLRRALGVSWDGLLTNPPVAPSERPHEADPLRGRDWRTLASACAGYQIYLNRWESEFVGGLNRFPAVVAEAARPPHGDRAQAASARMRGVTAPVGSLEPAELDEGTATRPGEADTDQCIASAGWCGWGFCPHG